MSDKSKSSVSKSLVAFNTSLASISFGTEWNDVEKSVDVTDRHIVGNVSAPHDFENHNYVRCFFEGNVISGFHMLHMDFKDTTFSSLEFRVCDVESSAFINCVFNNVIYTEGVFLNCTFQDCRFYGCNFNKVDLGNAFIKGCRISNCSFDNCKTENHVFEECLFSKTQFVACELQIDIVFKNYGLSRNLWFDCSIRNRRLREGGKVISEKEIDRYDAPENDLIAQLRMEYFRSDNFLEGNESLDVCLTNSSWLVGIHNDFTVGDKISQFVEFLINLWEEDEIPCHTLLLAHQMTSNLVEVLKSEEQELYRVLLTIMGTHMLLSRKVENYLYILDTMQRRLDGKPIVLIVNGPADEQYYKDILPQLFCSDGVSILKVKPHNSPSELYLSGITAVAWFLASLEKVRINIYTAEATETHSDSASCGLKKNNSSISISYDKGKMLELRTRALIPFSSLLVDFDLAVSTKIIGKFRRLVVTMLQDDTRKTSSATGDLKSIN